MLKGLFPMLTEHQSIEAGKALMKRDDPNECREAIRSYAASYEQFSVAGFINHLPARPGDDMPGMDTQQWQANRREREAIQRSHDADNAVCEQLSDAQYDATAAIVMREMDDDVRGLLMSRKNLRKSQWIRSLVAEYARVHGMLPNRIMEVA